MREKKKILIFAFIYLILSFGAEVVLIVFGGLRIPEDTGKVAIVLLTVVPALAAFLSGFRTLKSFLIVAFSAALLTLFLTVSVNKLTGLGTGNVEPIIVRFISGFIAAYFATNFSKTQSHS